jgi:hypothetical protein
MSKIWVATLLASALTLAPAIAQATEMKAGMTKHHHYHHHHMMSANAPVLGKSMMPKNQCHIEGQQLVCK